MRTIVEIISESQQGVTRPFLCRCDDGHEYFAKRFNAGRVAQIREWIAASLAQRLGLPVPPFDIAEVPPALLGLRTEAERREWGIGPVFVSRVIPEVVELRFTEIPQVPVRLRAAILLFDAWIGNDDRTLDAAGGNPNMLWSDRERQVSIIDHNLAFTASPDHVRSVHAFSAAATEWDLVFLNEWPQRLVAAAGALPHIWGQVPDVWIEDCVGLITLEQVRERLQLFTNASNPEWTIR